MNGARKKVIRRTKEVGLNLEPRCGDVLLFDVRH